MHACAESEFRVTQCTDAAKFNPWHRNVACGNGGFACSVQRCLCLVFLLPPWLKTLPLPCAPAASVAEDTAFALRFYCLRA